MFTTIGQATGWFRVYSFLLSAFVWSLAFCVVESSVAMAQDQTWDGVVNSTWDTTSSNWGGSAWLNGRGAIFGTTGAGAINVPGPISVNSLNFNANGYTLSGVGPMTFVNGTSTQTTGVVNVGTGFSATLNMPILSSVGFQKVGQGILEIGGSGNSFNGQIPLTTNGNLSVGFMVGPTGGIATNAPLSGTVRLLSANAMPASTSVGISNGYLDIGGNNVTVSSLVFTNQNQVRVWDSVRNANNGVIGTGTLRVAGEIHVLGRTGGNPGNSVATNLDLGGGTQIVRVGAGSSFGLNNALMFTGSLSNGSLTKSLGYNSTGVMGSVDGMSLFGNNTYTGSTILNSGTTVVTGTNTSQSLTITGTAGPGGSLVRLQGERGAFGSATTINALGGGTFEIDNAAAIGAAGNNTPNIPAAQNNNRISDSSTIQLRDGSFNYRGASSTAATETFGNLNSSGGFNAIRLTPGATGGTVELNGAGNLTVGSRSTLLIAAAGTGNTLGGNAKLKFNGTVPVADSTGIIRGIVVGAGGNFPSPQDLAIYDSADGFKANTVYSSDFSSAGTNVALAAATSVSTQSINALKTSGTFNTTIGAADTLTISSGMVISATGTNTFNGGTLAFGNTPGMLFGGNVINSAITGTDGLIHSSGALTLAGNMSGLSGTLTASSTGTTTLNTGTFAGPIHVRMGTLALGANQTGPGLGAITLGVSQNADSHFSGTPTLSFATNVTQIDRDIIVDNGGTNYDGILPGDSYVARISPANYTADRNFTGDITLNSDLAIFGGSATGAANASSLVFSGDISGDSRLLIRNGRVVFGPGSTWSNTGGLTIGGVGNSVQASFLGTGTGSGEIDVTGSTTGTMGTMRYNNNNSFGSGSITVNTGASTGLTFEATASSRITNQINLNNGTSATFINVGSGINAEWAGQITGNGILTKNGAGTWIISNNANTHTGTIVVSEGSLTVNSSVATSSNAFTIANGAALGGSGTINRNVTLDGRIAPGNSPGILTINGNLNSTSTGIFEFEINSNVGGTGYDQLFVNGSVTLGSANLNLKPGFGLNPTDRFFLLVNDGSDAIAGNFNGLTEGSSLVWSFAGVNQTAIITYLADFGSSSLTGGNDIAITAVPEPTSLLLLGAAIGFIGWRRIRGYRTSVEATKPSE